MWLDARFRSGFSGKKTGGRSQAREWPRTGASDVECNEIDPNEVPVEVLNSTFEAALRELANPGYLSPDYVASQRVVSESVGPISTTYSDKDVITAEDMRPVVTLIDDIMSSLLGNVEATPVLVGRSRRA